MREGTLILLTRSGLSVFSADKLECHLHLLGQGKHPLHEPFLRGPKYNFTVHKRICSGNVDR